MEYRPINWTGDWQSKAGAQLLAPPAHHWQIPTALADKQRIFLFFQKRSLDTVKQSTYMLCLHWGGCANSGGRRGCEACW
jgi:hypothetical protein